MNVQQDIQDRKLATAVAGLNPERVARALREGADPNVYSVNRYSFPLAIAARVWKAEGAQKARREKAGHIIDLLLDAGADPVAYHEGKSPLFDASVCAHPRCRQQILEAFPEHAHAIRRLDFNPDAKQLGSIHYLTRIATDTPLYREIRDHFLGINLPTEAWWRAALEAPTPDLMAYVVENRNRIAEGAPSIEWMTNAISRLPSGAPKQADGTLAWLKNLPMKDQVEAVLGSKGNEGFLAASIKKDAKMRDPIWEFALRQDHILAAIKDRGMTRGFLALSMLVKANHAQKLLRMALKEGINVAAMSVQQARQVKQDIPAWDNPFVDVSGKVNPDSTLLSGHLKNTAHSASVSLMRALVRAGVEPDYEALCALCVHMTYSAKEKRYLPLFDEWTEKHQVDPAPAGKTAAWDYITLTRPETPSRERFRNFLESRHWEKTMKHQIPDTDGREAARQPMGRARL